jgi:two-component system LytT family response regulator
MLKTIIIEDEFASRNALKNLLEKHCPSVQLWGNNDLDTMEKGVNAIRKLRPDLVFLDIKLSETEDAKNGFALLEQVRDVPFELVIVTAYRDFSFRAINEERRPSFFIHKPFDFDKVKESVRRVEENLLSKASIGVQGQTFSTIPGKLGLPSAEGTEYLPLARVVLLEAFGNVTKVWLWLETKPRVVSRHLGWFEKQLPCHVGSPFFRTHSSFIANRDYVKLFRHEGKKAVLMMENNLPVRVSEDRKAKVVEWLG